MTSRSCERQGWRRQQWRGTLEVVEYLGADIHNWVRLESGRRILAVERNLGQALARPGVPVSVGFDVEGCIVLPTR